MKKPHVSYINVPSGTWVFAEHRAVDSVLNQRMIVMAFLKVDQHGDCVVLPGLAMSA